MRVDVVIPNYNGAKLIEKHIGSVLSAHQNIDGKIIVVDDGSTDEDKKYLREVIHNLKSKKITLIEHSYNKGFASAINTGVSKATAGFVVLLNSDVAPKKNYLDSLISKMEADELIFAIGCLDESYENGKFVKRGRGIGEWKRGMVAHSRGEIDKSDTFWVSGGSCIIRRIIFEKLGGMDTLYNPFYWEDIDLSYRAQKAGYKIEFDRNSVVKHYHEEGAIKTGFKKDAITTTAYRNQFIFVWKNITSSNLLFSHFLFLPIQILGAIKRWDKPFIIGLFLALVKLPAIINKRKIQKKLYTVSDILLIDHIS